MKKILIICSGGLDSSSMALIKKQAGNAVDLVSFTYGQKAIKEIQSAKQLAVKLGGTYTEIDLASLAWVFGKNQLTDADTKVENDFKGSVVVPLRNGLLLQVAYIYAMVQQYDEVVLGSHLDDVTLDENGEYMFPDCSPEFFKAFYAAMQKGTRSTDKKTFITSASLEGYFKSSLIKECYAIDKAVLFNSWSCYKNGEHHCGTCDSCKNRRNAFKQAGIEDETIYGA